MDDPNVIRDQMESTRTALSDKLESLEGKVTATVQKATEQVAKTVATVTDGVQETVETVKDTVQDTVGTVKETVQDTLATVTENIGAVKGIFDVPRHVDRYPWIAMGGSLAFGFVLGELLYRRHASSPRSLGPSGQKDAATGLDVHNGKVDAGTENGSAHSASLLDQLAPDLSALKSLALGTLMGTVREMVAEAAGESLAQPLSEIIDSMTEKVGGKVIPPAADRPNEKNVQSPAEEGNAPPAESVRQPGTSKSAAAGRERREMAGVG